MRALFVAAGLRRPLPAACSVVNVAPLLRELILAAVEAPGALRRRRLLAAFLLDEIRAAPVAPLYLPEPEDPRLKRIASALRAEPGDPRTLARLEPRGRRERAHAEPAVPAPRPA